MDFFPCRSKSCVTSLPFLFSTADLVLWVLWAHQEATLKTGGLAEEQFDNM